MDEMYKPNSNKSKNTVEKVETEHHVDKIIEGNAIVKAKSPLRKMAGEFISEDARNIKSYILGDVLIPAIKKAISDIVTNGIDMLLYGESGGQRRRSTVDRVSYKQYYDGRSGGYVRESAKDMNRSIAASYSYDDIILSSRGEAEKVLSTMQDMIDEYGVVRVADLYDLVGVSGNYTDNKYGWTNLATAEITRARGGGYIIIMPRVTPID